LIVRFGEAQRREDAKVGVKAELEETEDFNLELRKAGTEAGYGVLDRSRKELTEGHALRRAATGRRGYVSLVFQIDVFVRVVI
jgi:hypothetical protein